MKKHFIVIGTICLFLFNSCASVINMSSLSNTKGYCQPQAYVDTENIVRLNDATIEQFPTNQNTLSKHNIYTANALGILPEFLKLDSFYRNRITVSIDEKTQLRLTILEKIQKIDEEIDGLAATLDCEGERTDQVANYLDQINSKRNNKITIASIIMGSLTTIATVAIEKNSAQNAVAIGGGILSSGLAAMTINPTGKQVNWILSSNLLEAIWYTDNKAHIIPFSIWYMLNTKSFSNSQKITLIESIKERWLHLNFQDEISKEDTKRFFQTGGLYAADDLHLRSNMINELQATVRTLHQDISLLTSALSIYFGNN